MSKETKNLVDIVEGDITLQCTEAIVNAANNRLLGGGGVYGYPVREAAPIAIETVVDYLGEHNDIELVRFILYNHEAYKVYDEILGDFF